MDKQTSCLKIELDGLSLATPVLPASGTFGYGDELREITDYSKLGAIVTKTLTIKEKKGNPQPRIWETGSGLLNSIGLQNIGVKRFCSEKLPCLKNLKKPVIVSIGGDSPEEIIEAVEFLKDKK